MRIPRGLRIRGLPQGCLVLLAVAFLALSAQPGELRTWTSKTGRYTTEAELVRVESDGKVVLKKNDGQIVTVALDQLSAADQAYVRSLNVDTGSPATSGATAAKTIDQIEQEAQQCRTAKDAVLVYKFYLADPKLSRQQRQAAEAALESWKKLADQDYVRLGTKWMPQSEADAIHKQVDEKIDHAIELLRLRNGELARRELEDASKLDPENIKADFLMGWVYGLIANNDRKAAHHFRRCLQRDPTNVSALNNLAISLVFLKEYPEAARHWQTAAAAAPKMQPLAQNVGSFLSLAGLGRLRVPQKTLRDLNELYKELTTTHGLKRPARVAFVYTPPYGADWNSQKEKGGPAQGGKQEAVVISSGTGFVVHPNLILTNRHVVQNASGLLILDPKNPTGEPLAAELVATSPDTDLALVRCEGLDAKPVPLTEKLPPRGADIMVLGYPLGPEFGTSLKATRGAMVAMPDPSMENMCLYDAVTNPGNSGGPLCDKSGRVVGVVRAVTVSLGGSYGAAIPVAHALPFLKQHIPDLATSNADAQELDWPAVDAQVAPSTVLIMKKELLKSDVGVGQEQRSAAQ